MLVDVKELLGFWSVKIGSFIGEMTEWHPAKVLVILYGSNPSFSAIFMTNCELVVGKYGS